MAKEDLLQKLLAEIIAQQNRQADALILDEVTEKYPPEIILMAAAISGWAITVIKKGEKTVPTLHKIDPKTKRLLGLE